MMGTELRVDGIARRIADAHEIVMGEERAEAVGIVPYLDMALPLNPQPVVGSLGGA